MKPKYYFPCSRVPSVSQMNLAANILNKQPRTADMGFSTSLGVGRGAKNPSP
jgi:hypothetical protein